MILTQQQHTNIHGTFMLDWPVSHDVQVEFPAHLEWMEPEKQDEDMSLSYDKHVSFSDSVEVAYFEPPTAAEVEASWLQPADKLRIKLDNKLCIVAYHRVGRRSSKCLPHIACGG